MTAANSSHEQWVPTGSATEIAPGLWRLPMPIPGHTLGGVCAYLVRDDDGYVMIDSGMDIPSCADAMERHLLEIGASISALHTIVVTHGHADHSGQAPGLRERSGASVWLHRRDAPLVRSQSPTGDADLAGLVRWLGRYGFPLDEARQASDSVDAGLGRTYLLEPDLLLEGGETLAVGPYRLEIVWTPGHTPGHVCVYEATRRILLTGDHLFGRAAPNVRLMPYSPLDIIGLYLQSLQKVAGLPAELALPAHGEPFERVGERIQQVIRHQISRRANLLGLLTDRPQTPYELARIVWGPGARTSWDTFHGRLRRNAALTLAGHLELMALEGEIERQEGETVGFALRG